MTFKSHDGLVEARQFTDFYFWLEEHPERRECPNCGARMTMHVYPTFNMNLRGRFNFICPNKSCEFSKEPLVIEAVGR